jgi:hypothetical protein
VIINFSTSKGPPMIFLSTRKVGQVVAPISTKFTIAPKGYSWHGQRLQNDLDGLDVRPLEVFCTPPVENSKAPRVAPSAADGQGVCTHVLPLAVKQFRKDWPFMAARLDSLRAKAAL